MFVLSVSSCPYSWIFLFLWFFCTNIGFGVGFHTEISIHIVIGIVVVVVVVDDDVVVVAAVNR